MRYTYGVFLINRLDPIKVKSNVHIEVILRELVSEKFITLDDKIFSTAQIQAVTLLLDNLKGD